MDSMGFMLFSTIEAFSLYYLIMSLFRFKWKRYVWKALIVILLLNFQSYLLRNDFSLENIVPLVSVLIFTLFFAAVVRMPFILAIIATVSGYVIFVAVQTVLIITMFGSISAIDSSKTNGYLLQLVSAIVLIVGSYAIYNTGRGFTFDLQRLKLKFEDVLLSSLIIISLIGMSALLYYKEIYVNILFFLVMSVFLLYFSIRKEKSDD